MTVSTTISIAASLVILAACTREHPTDATDTILIHDTFLPCVGPKLEFTSVGADHCPAGYREGGVCRFANGTKEFVEDTQPAVEACLKRGGELEG